MEVNREWWSGTERYINNSDNIDPDHVITTIGDLSTDIPANPTKYIGVEWDKTICPWKINYKSDFFNPQWCLPYYQSGSGNFKMAQAPFFKQRKKGYTFYICAAGGTASYQPHEVLSYYAATKPCWVNLLSRSDIDITQNPAQQWVYEKYYKTFPVVNFDYSKLFAFPMIHIENGAGYIFSDTAQAREDWDATGVYGVSIMFGVKTPYDGTDIVSVGIHSLNNKIAPPPWDTTNCWNENEMFDNGLALTHWNSWDGGWEIGGIQTLGTECTWSDSGASAGDPGFTDTQYPSDNVAGAILYYPAKNIMIQMPADSTEDSIWDDWTPYYKGGSHEYSCRRHLKSTVTFDQFATYLKKQLAYLGFRFCIDAEHFNDSIDSQYYYIPEIDSVGTTTGNYYAANTAEAHTLPNDTWNTNVYEQTPYDGTNDDEDEDPNTYSDQTDWHFDIVSPNSSFIKLYLLDQLRVESLHDKFYESLQSKPSGMSTEEFFSDTYLTNNPTDVIISLRYFNINLESAINTSPTAEEIKLGAYQTGISAKQPVQTTKLFDYGSCIYYPHFGDFRDYAPYSSAQLIIPYCGTVDIDPAQYMNTTINVKMLIDFASGACTAYILRNNLVIDSISGQIGIDLPVTGVASQDLLRNLFNGSQNLKAAKNANVQGMAAGAMGFISSALSGNYMGMASAAMNTMFNEENTMLQKETADFNLHHTNVPFRQIGAVDPMISTNQEQQCRLLVYRPIMGIESQEEYDSYAHTIGYACYDNAQLSGYTGFTVCAAADTSGIPATLKERAIIKQLLLSGIYL